MIDRPLASSRASFTRPNAISAIGLKGDTLMSYRDVYKNGKFQRRDYEKRHADGCRTITSYRGSKDFFGRFGSYGKGSTTHFGPRRKD